MQLASGVVKAAATVAAVSVPVGWFHDVGIGHWDGLWLTYMRGEGSGLLWLTWVLPEVLSR
jgi:hypothetical protein